VASVIGVIGFLSHKADGAERAELFLRVWALPGAKQYTAKFRAKWHIRRQDISITFIRKSDKNLRIFLTRGA